MITMLAQYRYEIKVAGDPRSSDVHYLLVVLFLGVYTLLPGIFLVSAAISAIPISRCHMAVNIVAREQGYKDM